MSALRRNLLVTVASSNVNMLIGFAASIPLARLLTPGEIGLFSVAFAFAGLFRGLRELGIGAYIVQEPELTDERLRSALGVAAVVAVLTSAAVALAAVPVATFYREPGMAQVLYVQAVGLLLASIGSTSLALLRRDLKFGEIAAAETFANVVQTIAAISFAWLGLGFMSLAWAGLVGIGASAAVGVYYRPAGRPWLPGLAQWRRVMAFCGFSSASSLAIYVNENASDLVLGRMMNVEAVAIFNRGFGISNLVGPIVMRAANGLSLPYFAEAQRQGQPLDALLARSMAWLGATCLPLYAVLAIVAEPLVLLLYGEPWRASAPIVQILCIAALVALPSALSSQLLTAAGAVQGAFRLEVYTLAWRLGLMIPAALISLHAVAWSYCLGNLLASFQRMAAVSAHLGRKQHTVRHFLSQSLWPTVLACVGPLAVMWLAPSPAVAVPACLVLAAAGWLCGALVGAGDVRNEVLGLLRKMRAAA